MGRARAASVVGGLTRRGAALLPVGAGERSMTARRIVHAVSSLNVGGAERLVVDLARLQRRDGFAVTILNFSDATDALCEEARSAGIDVVSLRRGAPFARRLHTIASCLRSRSPTGLHIHSPWCLRACAPFLPFFRGGIVYTRHGAHAYDSLGWRLLHAWTHRVVDHVTFVSEEALEVHRRAYGRLSVPLHVLEFGVETSVAERARRPGRLLRVGNVGRLVELKGQRFLLDAFALLSDLPDVELHLFGDGPDRAVLEQRAASLPNGRVFFHGAVMDREIIYASIDVLAVASRMEGLSLVIMEAMARAIPVVATEVGGNSRLVSTERTGLSVPYADSAAMASALRRLLTDPDLASKLGAAGRRHVESRYSLESAQQKLLELYGFTQPSSGAAAIV
jgi:glycosyltransferase involved in cell wall biosynthesis